MNLISVKSYLNTDITIRIQGEINYFAFELLSTETDISIKENEIIFYLNEHLKRTTYFSDTINNDVLLSDILPNKRRPNIYEPILINLIYSYSDHKHPFSFTTPAVSYTPITYDQRELNKIKLSIDSLIFVSKNSKLSEIYHVAILEINERILHFKKSYLFFNKEINFQKITKLITLIYELRNEIISINLPESETEREKEWIREISKEFYLDIPLQRCQSLFPPKDILAKMSGNGEKLINPHLKIDIFFSDSYLVKGRYTYYHYMQDQFNDRGWGCAYRSLQTIVSWFIWQGRCHIPIPSHTDIQRCLVRIGDKDLSFTNSRSWIGSFEINLVLQDLVGIDSKIISLTKGADLANIYDELRFHFQVHGSPIMIGGGQLAHTIIGVSRDGAGITRFLILDPHYTGLSSDLVTVLNKGWCGWKEISFWKKNLPYNLCLPLCDAGL